MEKSTEKTTVTIPTATREWLETTYPDALSLQEAIRMAVSDARTHQRYLAAMQDASEND